MPNVGAVILAAGGSSRLGRPKQLLQFRGKTLVRRIVDAALEGGCSPIVVVVGSDKVKIARELEQTNAVIVENVNWNSGMGTSIRCAVQHLIDTAPNVEAIALLVCDQPFVDSHTIEQLVALREKTKKAIVASSYAGTLGVPALFHRSCADELLHLDEEVDDDLTVLEQLLDRVALVRQELRCQSILAKVIHVGPSLQMQARFPASTERGASLVPASGSLATGAS